MLEVSILQSPSKADQRGFVGDHVGFPAGAGGGDCGDEFMGVDGNLLELEYMDFISCCDVPFFDADGDILPDLEVDPTELLAEFDDGEPPPDVKPQQAGKSTTTVVGEEDHHKAADDINNKQRGGVLQEKDDKKEAASNNNKKGDEGSSAVTTEEDSNGDTRSSASAGGHGRKKASKDSNGKRKVKVDWTPDLHRRFVQAVEQLGIDKAVPSRILEIMGIECLTRHNIASHLQKYRSHRKHLMAREAEAASWAQKRHMYAAAAAAGAPARKAAAPWVVPTIGFPPPFCRPLHVWGHPPPAAAAEGPPPPAMLPVWPRHLAPPRPWAPMDPAAYWNHQYNAASRKWGPHHQAAVTQGCPMPPPAMVQLPRFPVPPHPTMFRPAVVVPPPPPAATTTSKQQLAELQLQLDAHPSKESIDAAIGDVLVKPWLPLPLGLKPPSLHSVMSELHKQGIPKVPPAAASTG
ncbi:unnamed protein product [Urochloa humidicola]